MNTPFLFVFIFLSISLICAENIETSQNDQEATCVLPPYPDHGTYSVKNYPTAKPGEKYPSVKLTVSCNTRYRNVNSTDSVFCVNGDWSSSMPACVPFCNLASNLSTEYRCEVSGSGLMKGFRECESSVPIGTIVTPVCRSPGYFSLGVLDKMYCLEGIWNYIPNCKPACGTVSPHQLDGSSSDHVTLSWHAAVYNKLTKPYTQICGGSLVSSTKIISAAHCFWNENEQKLFPPSKYAVAVGKLYRPYDDPRDRNSQQSDVVDIMVPPRFLGAAALYENDIAIVVVETPFVYHLSVRPVCLDFDYNFDQTQLKTGNKGKASGWSVVDKNSKTPQALKVVDLPYITIEDCFKIIPPNFREYLSNDKFCLGSDNGTTLSRGDSGVGVAFLESTSQRYFLRGLVSVGPSDGAPSFNTFTYILSHGNFIRAHL